jgi:hypothetical protein
MSVTQYDLRCGSLVVSEACTRTSAVLNRGSQRGLLTLDTAKGSLTLVCRGPSPVELRVRFHWTLLELVKRKYPSLDTKEWLHAVCHECHGATKLFGRVLREALRGSPFHCSYDSHDLEDVVLAVDDLISSPMDAMDKALSTPVTSPDGVAQLCRLAARMVDTSEVLCSRHGHRPQLWVPLPAQASGGAGAGAGTATGSTDSMFEHGDDPLAWVTVCEHPAGWHVACLPVLGRLDYGLSTYVAEAVVALLQRVAAVVCAVGDIAGVSVPPAWRDWKEAVEPLLSGSSWGDTDWGALVRNLCDDSKSRVFALERHFCGWMCKEHALAVPVPSEVRTTTACTSVGTSGDVLLCLFIC